MLFEILNKSGTVQSNREIVTGIFKKFVSGLSHLRADLLRCVENEKEPSNILELLAARVCTDYKILNNCRNWICKYFKNSYYENLYYIKKTSYYD